jgi:two-component system, chemotaxis family, chemotaxis protein CheY
MRILIVDDDYVSRSKLKAILGLQGDCDCAAGGEIALKMFAAADKELVPYGLVTVDIEMPEMNGQELVTQLRQWEEKHGVALTERAKILMVTIKKELRAVSTSYSEGCDGYLVKPVTPESVAQGLKEIGLDVTKK